MFINLTNYFYLLQKKIKKYYHNIFFNLIIKIYFIFSFLINILIWLFAKYICLEIDGEMMALHYNVDFGIDYYGKVENIYIIPIVGLFVIFFNFILFFIFSNYKGKNFFAHILFLTSIIVNIILLTAIALIYLVNFR